MSHFSARYTHGNGILTILFYYIIIKLGSDIFTQMSYKNLKLVQITQYLLKKIISFIKFNLQTLFSYAMGVECPFRLITPAF